MDWNAPATPDARRIAGDIARLRAARIASGGAGAPRAIATTHPALLAIGCGTDTVFLNFSAAPVALDAAGHDRLTGATIADLPAWGMAWIEGEAA